MLDAGASAFLRAQFALAGLLIAVTILLTQLVIHNGIAVTFPGWVRLTPGAGAGAVEMMGETMVTFYGGFLALIVALLVPAAAATVTWAAPLVSSVVFAAILLVECAAATELPGRVLDRADLQNVAIVE